MPKLLFSILCDRLERHSALPSFGKLVSQRGSMIADNSNCYTHGKVSRPNECVHKRYHLRSLFNHAPKDKPDLAEKGRCRMTKAVLKA